MLNAEIIRYFTTKTKKLKKTYCVVCMDCDYDQMNFSTNVTQNEINSVAHTHLL